MSAGISFQAIADRIKGVVFGRQDLRAAMEKTKKPARSDGLLLGPVNENAPCAIRIFRTGVEM